MAASELVEQLKRPAVDERYARRPFVDERELRERRASETDRILGLLPSSKLGRHRRFVLTDVEVALRGL